MLAPQFLCACGCVETPYRVAPLATAGFLIVISKCLALAFLGFMLGKSGGSCLCTLRSTG